MTDPFLKDEAYLAGINGIYLEEMHERYLANPSSVDPSWQRFFGGFSEDKHAVKAALGGASWGEYERGIMRPQSDAAANAAPRMDTLRATQQLSSPSIEDGVSLESLRAIMMIRAYRVRGHLIADLDPLRQEPNKYHPELDPATYGFGEADMDREIFIDGVLGMQSATLREILDILKSTYCGTMAVEFMHIQYPDQKSWIQQRMEAARGKPDITEEERKIILRKLIEIEAFEQFLHVKYPGTKRFSIQGGDTAIAGLEMVIEQGARRGVKEISIGMPHRGRMNVITTVMGKPYTELLSIFQGGLDFPEGLESSGDVKYHLGTSSDRVIDGNVIHLSLAANPSHLEAVNPVVCGKVRAKLRQRGDIKTKKTVMPVLLHGDAAFAGQGSVAETLSFSELIGYRSGGSVHIIVNNQIGFTTSPKNARFTPYPSDVAKAVQAPIFHVNGDDAEAVAFVCKLATDFRQEFGRDVVVDVFCYRKYGHNEGDEPMFTQPLMYKTIKEKKAPAVLYANQLIDSGALTQDDVDKIYAECKEMFDKDFESAATYMPNKADWLEGKWSGLIKPNPHEEHPAVDTGVEIDTLKEIGTRLAHFPEGFNVNSKIVRQLEAKKQMMQTGENLDWSMCEALAFGTLLTEGYSVRLSGQDSERGTFSHRHSVLNDQENEKKYRPLNHLKEGQANYEVINSSLSEFAILGFEYGYSLAEPNGLTIWEAQFGDFANGAQVIIDQFISSGEIKWLRMSGLVMLLPHGYEGQGPEHSSARLERFLSMCGEDNWQVINATTPANFFHALRRQLHRDFRKPLIVMTPKSLLRHKLAVSKLADLGPGTTFQRVLPEVDAIDANNVKRVVLTSGKVYYDLYEARAEQKIDDVALIRVEQYYPFPGREIAEELAKYPDDAEIMWCQEEPENMGAHRFIVPRLMNVLDDIGRDRVRIKYAGRPEAASPATGYAKIHAKQQAELVAQALTLHPAEAKAAIRTGPTLAKPTAKPAA